MQSLETVEVTAEKQHIEFQIDKKVVNVSQDLMAQGGTAVNALENTPSVTVDVNGDVSLRGSSNFLVLVDGRPSVLQGSDALQQIPASNIDRIEIITNPSAKFDPDGSAGIINVILKQKESGVNGIFNLSVGTKKKFNTDFFYSITVRVSLISLLVQVIEISIRAEEGNLFRRLTSMIQPVISFRLAIGKCIVQAITLEGYRVFHDRQNLFII